MNTATAPNPILEVSPRDYHTRLTLDRDNILSPDSWLSKSALWELKTRSLFQWKYYPRPFTGSDAADWGTMVDCLLTTPEEFEEITILHQFSDFRTKAAREMRDQAKEEGKILLNLETFENVKRAAEKIRSHRIAGGIVEESSSQVILHGKSHGVQVKGLADLVPASGYLVDIKTTGKWTRSDIEKSIDSLGYHIQAGLYLFLWNQMHPEDLRNRFRFIWQQSETPYEVAVTELPTAEIHAGQEWAAYQIERLKKATERNQWPGIFGDTVALVGRPGYALFRDEEDFEPLPEAPPLK